MSVDAERPAPLMHAWRHPAPKGAAGRCIGARTDLPVDRRKAKRLAHRIRAIARREGLPRAVATSPLARCRDVGRWLRRFGFRHVVDAQLAELDFGRWDGRCWEAIDAAEIAAWSADLVGHAPGGGESVRVLLSRVRAVHARAPAALLVTHGGWLSAAVWLALGEAHAPTAATWPKAPGYGRRVALWRLQAPALHRPSDR
ncbi:bifunctional RNase H/acid phosphatase [Methylibium sp. T29]|nr:histidine phosphatase family protein [Methylibium sp. T29-B]EWS53718.1 bifunctional RNase H/acid phosphatase [Methylibium sp. T29]EWS57578.1 bifunctional RNase H/acid phosphatase [Methylibium sp. T29-B]